MISRRLAIAFKLLLSLLLIIFAAASLYLWIYGDDLVKQLTPRIEAELERNLKAKISIANLKIKLFPKFGISLESVKIQPENSCGVILATQGLLYVDLMALIRGIYIIDYVSLHSARATISIFDQKIALVDEANLNCDRALTAQSSAAPIMPVENAAKDLSVPIALRLEKLRLEDLQLTILGPKVHKFVIVNLTSQASLENGKLDLNSPKIEATFDSIPISLSAQKAQIDIDAQSIAFEEGALKVAEEILRFSGKLESIRKFQDLKIAATNFQLSKLTDILQVFGLNTPSILSGVATISATLNSSEESGLAVSAETRLVDLEVLPLPRVGARSGRPSAAYKVAKFEAKTELNSRELLINSPVLEASFEGTPLSLRADSLALKFADLNLNMSKARLSISGQSIEMTGEVNNRGHFSNLQLNGKSIDLTKIPKLSALFGIKAAEVKSGLLTFSVLANSLEKSPLNLQGNINIREFSTLDSQLAWNDLHLQQLQFVGSLGAAGSAKANLSLKKATFIDRSTTYEIGSAQGPMQLNLHSGKSALNGELGIEGFGYNDGYTELRNISGRLRDLKGASAKNGEIRISSQIEAASMELITPEVTVKHVERVSVPLLVEVKTGGGYQVSGVVSAKGGAVKLAGRDLSQVGGKVRILISEPLKEFEIQPVSFVSMERSIVTNGSFIMKPDQYSFRNIQTKINSGTLSIEGSIGRASDKVYAAEILLKDIQAVDLISLSKGAESNQFEGTLSKAKLSLSGSMLAALESLKANGSFQVSGADIKGFNLSQAIGNAIKAISFADVKLSPEKLSDDEKVKTAEAEFLVADQIITFSKARIFRPNYTINGHGSFNFNQEIDFKASVSFAQETLKSLGGGFDRLAALMGRVGKIEIPLLVKGKIPDVSITPDLVTLVRDNSGLTLVGDVVGATRKVGRGVTDILMRPFETNKGK